MSSPKEVHDPTSKLFSTKNPTIYFYEIKDYIRLSSDKKRFKFGIMSDTIKNFMSKNKDKMKDNKLHTMMIVKDIDIPTLRKVIYKKFSENPNTIKIKIENMNNIYESTYGELMKDIEWVNNYEDNFDEYLKTKIKVEKRTSNVIEEPRQSYSRKAKKDKNYKEKSTSSSKKQLSSSEKEEKRKKRQLSLSSKETPDKPPRKHKHKKMKILKEEKRRKRQLSSSSKETSGKTPRKHKHKKMKM